MFGFLFPLIQFPGMPATRPEIPEISVPGREEFYGDDMKYLQPELSNFKFLCFPLNSNSPGVYDVDFCLPYFPEEDISVNSETIFTDR